MITTIIKEVTKIDIDKSIESKKKLMKRIKNGCKIENTINNFSPLQKLIETLHNKLNQLSKNFILIIFIDELDRCLPEYSIKVLERLHHVCNELQLIQILAIDKKNLSDSIADVFGKDYRNKQNALVWNEHFTDKYLQKFVDLIIPLPKGKPNEKLEILNGLEKNYFSYSFNVGINQINLNEQYLSEFISQLFENIDRRTQEKILRQVSLCHELTLQELKDFNKEHISYSFLIYEIISCICHYVFHFQKTCEVNRDTNNYFLSFYNSDGEDFNPYITENKIFNKNLRNLLNTPIQRYLNNSYEIAPYKITNTQSYIMAFFYKSDDVDTDSLQRGLWNYILEDQEFLNKYDEIMRMLVNKF